MNQSKSGLSDILFPKVRQSVLAILYGNPNSTFYLNEIIRLTGSGTGAVQRELTKLVQAGLLSKTVIGKQYHYKANKNSPLYSDLRNIVLKTFGLADLLKNSLQSVESDIKFSFIYGSVAKHEDTSSSDIDLFILSDTLLYADIFGLLDDAEKQLGRKVNPTFYSQKDFVLKLKMKNNFIDKIISQPKIFLIGTSDDIDKLR